MIMPKKSSKVTHISGANEDAIQIINSFTAEKEINDDIRKFRQNTKFIENALKHSGVDTGSLKQFNQMSALWNHLQTAREGEAAKVPIDMFFMEVKGQLFKKYPLAWLAIESSSRAIVALDPLIHETIIAPNEAYIEERRKVEEQICNGLRPDQKVYLDAPLSEEMASAIGSLKAMQALAKFWISPGRPIYDNLVPEEIKALSQGITNAVNSLGDGLVLHEYERQKILEMLKTDDFDPNFPLTFTDVRTLLYPFGEPAIKYVSVPGNGGGSEEEGAENLVPKSKAQVGDVLNCIEEASARPLSPEAQKETSLVEEIAAQRARPNELIPSIEPLYDFSEYDPSHELSSTIRKWLDTDSNFMAFYHQHCPLLEFGSGEGIFSKQFSNIDDAHLLFQRYYAAYIENPEAVKKNAESIYKPPTIGERLKETFGPLRYSIRGTTNNFEAEFGNCEPGIGSPYNPDFISTYQHFQNIGKKHFQTYVRRIQPYRDRINALYNRQLTLSQEANNIRNNYERFTLSAQEYKDKLQTITMKVSNLKKDCKTLHDEIDAVTGSNSKFNKGIKPEDQIPKKDRNRFWKQLFDTTRKQVLGEINSVTDKVSQINIPLPSKSDFDKAAKILQREIGDATANTDKNADANALTILDYALHQIKTGEILQQDSLDSLTQLWKKYSNSLESTDEKKELLVGSIIHALQHLDEGSWPVGFKVMVAITEYSTVPEKRMERLRFLVDHYNNRNYADNPQDWETDIQLNRFFLANDELFDQIKLGHEAFYRESQQRLVLENGGSSHEEILAQAFFAEYLSKWQDVSTLATHLLEEGAEDLNVAILRWKAAVNLKEPADDAYEDIRRLVSNAGFSMATKSSQSDAVENVGKTEQLTLTEINRYQAQEICNYVEGQRFGRAYEEKLTIDDCRNLLELIQLIWINLPFIYNRKLRYGVDFFLEITSTVIYFLGKTSEVLLVEQSGLAVDISSNVEFVKVAKKIISESKPTSFKSFIIDVDTVFTTIKAGISFYYEGRTPRDLAAGLHLLSFIINCVKLRLGVSNPVHKVYELQLLQQGLELLGFGFNYVDEYYVRNYGYLPTNSVYTTLASVVEGVSRANTVKWYFTLTRFRDIFTGLNFLNGVRWATEFSSVLTKATAFSGYIVVLDLRDNIAQTLRVAPYGRLHTNVNLKLASGKPLEAYQESIQMECIPRHTQNLVDNYEDCVEYIEELSEFISKKLKEDGFPELLADFFYSTLKDLNAYTLCTYFFVKPVVLSLFFVFPSNSMVFRFSNNNLHYACQSQRLTAALMAHGSSFVSVDDKRNILPEISFIFEGYMAILESYMHLIPKKKEEVNFYHWMVDVDDVDEDHNGNFTLLSSAFNAYKALIMEKLPEEEHRKKINALKSVTETMQDLSIFNTRAVVELRCLNAELLDMLGEYDASRKIFTGINVDQTNGTLCVKLKINNIFKLKESNSTFSKSQVMELATLMSFIFVSLDSFQENALFFLSLTKELSTSLSVMTSKERLSAASALLSTMEKLNLREYIDSLNDSDMAFYYCFMANLYYYSHYNNTMAFKALKTFASLNRGNLNLLLEKGECQNISEEFEKAELYYKSLDENILLESVISFLGYLEWFIFGDQAKLKITSCWPFACADAGSLDELLLNKEPVFPLPSADKQTALTEYYTPQFNCQADDESLYDDATYFDSRSNGSKAHAETAAKETWHCKQEKQQRVCVNVDSTTRRVVSRLDSSVPWDGIKGDRYQRCEVTYEGPTETVRHCVGEETEYVEYTQHSEIEPSLTSAMGYSALNGAAMAALPEALGDALELSGYCSARTAGYVKTTITVGTALATGGWMSAVVNRSTAFLARRAGFSDQHASVAGNSAGFFVNIAKNITPIGLASTAANYAGGYAGMWLEKKVMQQLKVNTQPHTMKAS